MAYHVPVLLKESIDGLNIDPSGTYVDVTFGGGGHAWEIFQQLTTGHLIVMDQDADARRNAAKFEADLQERSFTFIESNFRFLKKYLKFHGVGEIDGLLADLGVSSHQFDSAGRGFSTRFDGPLDMRMNQRSGLSAKSWINEAEEKDLIHAFSAYGEIKNARTLAQRIVNARAAGPLDTTDQLKQIALEIAPKNRELKYLAQLYQAIRIVINEEMEALQNLLEQAAEVLRPTGRLVTIAYHSLEDRLVKNFMASGNFRGRQEKDLFGNVIRPMDAVNRKVIIPGLDEINANNRARSAKMRIGQKRDGK